MKEYQDLGFCCSGIAGSIPAGGRGGKNKRALFAGNVKQLREIRLNEDLLLKI
jgi:hypothetical protein